ncbi:MAG: hypothetical protein OER43_01350 [Gammaproteobacteria bacterium]|nr:hypothetical protein [Gammaproteobacteria bacterium]MDH3412209.1 hypothetical protein [Gammaproteobacteria bacterium]
MQSVMVSEQQRLSVDVKCLSQVLASQPRPLGLKQRAKSAFLKQLHAYKCQRLEHLSGGLGRVRSARDDEAKRIGRI